MKGWKSSAAVQAAIRATIRMNDLLGRGNIQAALGLKTSVYPESPREGFSLPRPTYRTATGARVWGFPAR